MSAESAQAWRSSQSSRSHPPTLLSGAPLSVVTGASRRVGRRRAGTGIQLPPPQGPRGRCPLPLLLRKSISRKHCRNCREEPGVSRGRPGSEVPAWGRYLLDGSPPRPAEALQASGSCALGLRVHPAGLPTCHSLSVKTESTTCVEQVYNLFGALGPLGPSGVSLPPSLPFRGVVKI